jgi:hypothetical protein
MNLNPMETPQPLPETEPPQHPSSPRPSRKRTTKKITLTKRGKPKRRPDKREKKPGRIELTARDLDIISAVYTYRILSRDQIMRLFGFTTARLCNRVLIRLFQHQFLGRRFAEVKRAEGRSPTYYVLDTAGIALMYERYGIEKISTPPRDLDTTFLQHSTGITDVRITFTLACQTLGYQLLEWRDEQQMKDSYDYVQLPKLIKPVSVIPDSFFKIRLPGKGIALFFLEFDNAKTSSSRFKLKILAYQEYVESGAFQKRYNAPGMRVLTVVPSLPRLLTLKKATREAGGMGRYWFALASDITPETVLTARIWHKAHLEDKTSILEG